MLRFVSTPAYCPVDSTVFLALSFRYLPSFTERCGRAPYKTKLGRPGYTKFRKSAMNVGCTQRSRRLFLGRSLCRGTRKSRGRAQRNGRAALSKWVELRNVLRSVKSILRPVLPCSYSSNLYSSYLLLIFAALSVSVTV